ncbi:hypothetical protein [Streptomyces sp. CB02923]|uniref:hypothetical protein n=1 Tax=Streptomyces sp. CB02923 TaxID=1718985 RepID=UPI0009401B9E|nr:hypothetical protein [Streptomyces sp. CB02923]
MIKKMAAAALLAGSVATTAPTAAHAAGISQVLGKTTATTAVTTTELVSHLPHIHGLRPPPAFAFQQVRGK